MSRHYARRRAGWKENLGSAMVAAGVGAAVFYLTRLLLARESLGTEHAHSRLSEGEDDHAGEGGARLPSGDGRRGNGEA